MNEIELLKRQLIIERLKTKIESYENKEKRRRLVGDSNNPGLHDISSVSSN